MVWAAITVLLVKSNANITKGKSIIPMERFGGVKDF
jgi:hypothetical protein